MKSLTDNQRNSLQQAITKILLSSSSDSIVKDLTDELNKLSEPFYEFKIEEKLIDNSGKLIIYIKTEKSKDFIQYEADVTHEPITFDQLLQEKP